MKEKTWKHIWYASILLYAVTLFYSFVHNIRAGDWEHVGMAFVAVLTPCIVPAVFRVFRWKPVYEIYLLCQHLGRFFRGIPLLGIRQAASFFQRLAAFCCCGYALFCHKADQ